MSDRPTIERKPVPKITSQTSGRTREAKKRLRWRRKRRNSRSTIPTKQRSDMAVMPPSPTMRGGRNSRAAKRPRCHDDRQECGLRGARSCGRRAPPRPAGASPTGQLPPPRTLRANALQDGAAAGHVEAHRRLVEQQQARPMQQGARDLDPPALAAGQSAHEIVHARNEAEALELLLDPHTRCRRGTGRAAQRGNGATGPP